MASLVNRLGVRLFRQSTNKWNTLAAVPFKRHLPVCTVDTNLPKEKIPESFCGDITQLIATSMDKPIKVIFISIIKSVETFVYYNLNYAMNIIASVHKRAEDWMPRIRYILEQIHILGSIQFVLIQRLI